MANIYLISPPIIEEKSFAKDLEKALITGLVPVFQLRLKNYPDRKILSIAKELKKICDNNNCLFIINDFVEIAISVGASGVHVGTDDLKISKIRQMVDDSFVIGASCYNSRDMAMKAGEEGANYISFGAFFPTSTKIARATASIEILSWANEMLNLPIVTIGGINNENAKDLVQNGADFLAVISYIWGNPHGIETALKKLYDVCNSSK